MSKTVNNNVEVVEIRSAINDNVVHTFEHSNDESTNIFTAGYTKICNMLNINRVVAEQRYYIAKQ